MQTVLVVEDEKLIRQGISAMIKRCGVPVTEVIECANGLKAMEILRQKEVDVMFTDIRMPKMNGIELVKTMQELERLPITIAVSGYDDFSYAVEMMRHGVREYILKPVERDKLREVMEKLEKEISQKKDTEQKTEKLGKKFLKYILTDGEDNREDMEILGKRIKADAGDSFNVLVTTRDDEVQKELVDIEPIAEIEGMDVFIIGTDKLQCIKKRICDEEDGFVSYAGISDTFSDVGMLKNAYLQAKTRREKAFFAEEPVLSDKEIKVQDALAENGRKLCEKTAVSARVQLTGTDRVGAIEKEWNAFFIAAKRRLIMPEDFISAMTRFTQEYLAVYKRDLHEKIGNPYLHNNLSVYKEIVLETIFEENSRLLDRASEGQTEKKMLKAVNYVRENYNTDINMAVVSNYVSMNYSLFSTAFKNFTGKNFVSYIRELRIDEAKRLLKETEMRVNEIGLRVGYENDKHFMKNFKASVGVSPSEFRRNIQLQASK
ncbi:response regulator transcription factor [Butyrivibrio sp. VCB2006]|uniref:response regulator transcription factor n=1 Tax=Butyrivibrio sp. VCB2006 TaxID=1280679 RepID=UPI0004258BCC|nr:response regulator [Butyrivibrio sp. VCB2006]